MRFSAPRRDPKSDKDKSDYSNRFEEMLGSQSSTKLSKEEQDFIKRQVEAKIVSDEAAQKEHAEKAERIAKEKEQQFDDMLKGKEAKAQNLQDMFKDLYSAAQSRVKDGGNIINSAKNSVGSLGSKLEQRR